MRYEHARPSLSPRTRTFRALPTAATSVSGQTHTSRHRLPGCAFSVTKLPREASKHRRTELTFSSPSYGPVYVAQVSGLVSDAVGDEWRHYPLGWHWVLVIFGGLVLVPTAAAFCGPKKPPGELVMYAEYGAAK